MTLSELLKFYSLHPQIKLLTSKTSASHIVISGLAGSSRSFVAAAFFIANNRHQLIICQNQDEALYLAADLAALMQQTITQAGQVIANNSVEQRVYYFPSAYRLRQRNQQADEVYMIQRAELLNRLANDKSGCIIVTYLDALNEPVAPVEKVQKETISLKAGQDIRQDYLTEQLQKSGFTRVDFVFQPGQYAVRGSIVDVFSYSHEEPYRIDFFGDEIDSIRIFDIETQLSQHKLSDIRIMPAVKQAGQTGTESLFDYLPSTAILCSTDTMPSELKDKNFSTIEYSQRSLYDESSKISFHTIPQPIFHKNFDMLIKQLRDYTQQQYHIYILSDSKKQTDRIAAIFEDKSADLSFVPIEQTLHEGFVDHDAKICCLTDHQIFERFHKVMPKEEKARQGKALITLKELNQLNIGDYVVHVDHGIGTFGGLVRTTVNGKPQEMIKLIYRDNDILFVSIHSLHRISKYKGKEGGAPTISKLGSGQWERLKERTKNKVKDIARDLIKLYAQRHAEKGFQYSPDSYMQHELEASFIYEDTPDQQKATNDVKHDMESPVPMDRLICGDVGFGKTEVAMRAAFKAATDNKQTAVLVPTTVLALQHYNTFKERFAGFPVRIEYLSRAKSSAQTKEILKELEEGKIDILIGTHKLVGKSVKFKDLGLLIIDEEQKFGVATKEKLRQMKVNVDTLTLTATPIPRTLQFSLLGARDMSVMTTPPPNRYPVQTELITEADEDIIQEAIRLEINRNGQVLVVNNRIQTLNRIEDKIRRLCPEARVAVAHGQMPTDEMEQILTDFINYDYDILISTTIIEAGVDIPNANTAIIFSANQYGLSDLHQLRGRVGRSNRKAYCYLVAPPNETLTLDARRRLSAVEMFSDLGSGFHIAMQDLDIRGAGNMLGAEQSGFIADLGYETYQRILNEAIVELKEEMLTNRQQKELQEHIDEEAADFLPITGSAFSKTGWVTDCSLESDLEIGFPPEYIENVSERIALYRELDNIQTEEQLQAYKSRLTDRFGELPMEAEELLSVVRLRWQCVRLGIEKLTLKMNRMIISFPSNNNSAYYKSSEFGKIIDYIVNHPRRCQLREQNGKRSAVILNVRSMQTAKELISEFESY